MADKYFQVFYNMVTDQSLKNSISSIMQAVASIWTPDVRLVKDFSDHGPEHNERVFGRMLQLLGPVNADSFLNESEIYTLILSVILHDIGMQCDIKKHRMVKERATSQYGAVFTLPFDTGNANNYSKDEQIEIRNNHHFLTAAWLDEQFMEPDSDSALYAFNTIPRDLRADVIDVCLFHRKLTITDCPEQGSIAPIRTRFLAALLRLSDELDIEKYRVDVNTVKQFGYNTENSFFWYLHENTKVIIENHAIRLNIVLHENDYNLCKDVLQRVVIGQFNSKNRGLTEILRANEINIGISEQSQVIPGRYQLPLPREILDYVISLDSQGDLYNLRIHLNRLLLDTWNQHPSSQLLQTNSSQDKIIDSRLFPEYEEANRFENALMNRTGNYAVSPIWTAIRESWLREENHPVIIQGDGGLGKTVSLFSISTVSENELPIPAIYVPAFDLLDSEGHCLDFAQFLHNKYPEDHQLIGKYAKIHWNKGPRLLVLLDGMNEVLASKRADALATILSWLSTHPGAQLIIVSRPMDNLNVLGEIKDQLAVEPIVLTLKPLDEDTVRTIIQENHRKAPVASLPIWKDLKYPLFLNLFLQTGNLKGRTNAGYPLEIMDSDSGGALIWNYFQRELLRNIKTPNIKVREKWVIRCSVTCELIAPAIAYYMVKEHLLVIDYIDAKRIINGILDTLGNAKLPDHLRIVANIYESKNYKKLDQTFLSTTEWYDAVFRETEILVRSPQGGKETDLIYYRFKHQHFRDFLVGLYLVNQAVTAENSSVPEEWHHIPEPQVLDYCADLISDQTVQKLWESIRSEQQYSKEHYEPDHNSICCFLEISARRPKLSTGLDFSGMDIRGLYLSHYLGLNDVDLELFRDPLQTKKTRLDTHVFRCVGHDSSVHCLGVLPNGYCVSGADDTTLRVWNPASGQFLWALRGHEYEITCLGIFPNGQCVSGAGDGSLIVWDPLKGIAQYKLKGHNTEISCVTILSNERFISGSLDGTLKVWEPQKTLDCIYEFRAHSQAVNCLATLPDGRFVSASDDKTLKIWDPNTWKCIPLEGHTEAVTCLAVLPSGKIVSGSNDGTVRVWNSEHGDCIYSCKEHYGPVTCIATISESCCISGSRDNNVIVWDLSAGKRIRTLSGHSGSIRCVLPLPDNRCVSGSSDRTLCVWDFRSGQLICDFHEHNAVINNVCVTSDGRLISASGDPALRVWDSATGRCLHVLGGHSWEITCVATMKDHICICGSSNGNLYLWDTARGCLVLPPLVGHTKRINCVLPLQNGMCVSGSEDATIRIWDLNTSKWQAKMSVDNCAVTCLCELPDNHFVSGFEDGSIMIWSPDGNSVAHKVNVGTAPVEEMIAIAGGSFVCRLKDRTQRAFVFLHDEITTVEYMDDYYSSDNKAIKMPDGRVVSITLDKNLAIKGKNSDAHYKTPEEVTCLASFSDGTIVCGLKDNTLMVLSTESTETLKCERILEPTEIDVSQMNFSLADLEPRLRKLLWRNLARVPEEEATVNS